MILNIIKKIFFYDAFELCKKKSYDIDTYII